MPVVTEHMKWRRPRNQFRHSISETDANPQTPSITQSSHSKSTISSLLSSLSTATTSNGTTHSRDQNKNNNKKSNRKFSAATFRGFGCTAGASQKVSVPAVIRSSADWEGTRNRKKKHRRNGNSGKTCDEVVDDGSVKTCVDFQDVWCGPGIGFSTDAVTRKNVSARGKLDVVERVTHRERPCYFGRRTVKPESFPFVDDDPDIFAARPGLEPFGTARFYRHVPHPSSDGLAQIMIIQGRIMMGGRLDSHDQFSEWRLDVDDMSYEELLELGERIGYVNTGLKEDEVGLNIRKVKLPSSNDTTKHQIDKQCSVCQEEYESDDELGRLKCEHCYHFQCIKQWLVHKNFCPVCKQEVVVRP
ncbi:E3 ubiquitin-protein ligase MBR1, partial [Mucuna pruriens]